MRVRGTAPGILVLGVSTFAFLGSSVAEEPGASAVAAAGDAVAKVAAAAKKPSANLEALGDALVDLSNAGGPKAPDHRGLAVDAAAQPFLENVEPRLRTLVEKILDRRHRFVTGEDRSPTEKRPELVTAVFDVRSLTGHWRDDELQSSNKLSAPGAIATSPDLFDRPIHFDGDMIRHALLVELGDEARSIEFDNGMIFVQAPKGAISRAQELIDLFKGAIGPRVSVEVAAYRMTREVWLEHARAQGDEADRVIERALASGKAQLVSARDAVMEDGALGTFAPTGKQAIVAGLEVNQTGVVPVVNPVVSKIPLGVYGHVRATLAPGRKEVILDVDVTLRELASLRHETVHQDELALPQTSVTRCGTTLVVPLGRTVLVGGTLAGIQELSSSCVFAVKATPFSRATSPRVAKEAPEKEPAPPALPESSRPEVQELDQLLALVRDALSKVHAAQHHEWAVFDVRDVIEDTHTRVAPVLGFASSEHRGSGGRGGMAGATLTFGDDARVGMPSAELEQLIKRDTGADEAWASPSTFETVAGLLVLYATPGTLAGVAKLHEDMAKDRTGNVEVSLEWCRLEDTLVAELRRSGVVLSKEALEKLDASIKDGDRAVRATSAFVVAQRGDVGVVAGGTETSYVSGFEYSSGGTGTYVETAGVPLTAFAREGLALEALAHGDGSGAEGALVLDARIGLARTTDTFVSRTPGGPIATPAVDDSESKFDGLVPEGAIALLANRAPGEKRPALVGVLRARNASRP